jgi:hypothetical protein
MLQEEGNRFQLPGLPQCCVNDASQVSANRVKGTLQVFRALLQSTNLTSMRSQNDTQRLARKRRERQRY